MKFYIDLIQRKMYELDFFFVDYVVITSKLTEAMLKSTAGNF